MEIGHTLKIGNAKIKNQNGGIRLRRMTSSVLNFASFDFAQDML